MGHGQVASAMAIVLLGVGCGPTLQPGELGPLRYFGDLLGEAPMRLLPPITDRSGNLYVLYGAVDRIDTTVYVGQALGGWSGGCQAHRGTDGVHGWVGRTDDRAWYWAGSALVEVDGLTGACQEVLRNDPVSGTELDFLAVAPRVDDTPSHRYAYALVQGVTGDPQFVVIDLDGNLPFNPLQFPADDPDVITVVGTGAWEAKRQSAFVVSYEEGSSRTAAVLYLDRLGQLVNSAPLDLPGDLEPYTVPGDIAFNDQGIGIGVFGDGRILVVSQTTGGIIEADGWLPEGAFTWQGTVYVVGSDGNTPAIAAVTPAGEVGSPVAFAAAQQAQERLASPVQVNDERSAPSRLRDWDAPRSAIGTLPLVSPYPLDAYTTSSTGWLVAGPDFASGVEPVTAVAFAPIGLAVP